MSLESVNPFNDPEWKKQIMESENIESPDSEVDIKSLVASAPQLPRSARNIIMDGSALARSEKEEKAKELTVALNTVFSEYNEKYGTDLSISFDDLSRTLVNVADPEKRRVLELYTSEIFKSIRPVLLLHVLQRLTLALDQVLQPKNLFDSSFSAADSIILIEKLIGFIVQIQDMIKEIEIPDSDTILKRMAEGKNELNLDNEENKKVIDDFMKILLKDK